jgi:taurine--2-oxoglutarate transaminase
MDCRRLVWQSGAGDKFHGETDMSNSEAVWVDKHRHFLMPWSVQESGHRAPVIERAEGVNFIDTQGRKYVDLSSGWVSTNLGHGDKHVIAAMKAQLDRLCFAPPNFVIDTRAEFVEALCKLAPWTEGARVHFTAGGADANDDAVKIARMITGRHKVLTAYRSFHGSSSGASSLTGGNRRWPAEPAAPGGVIHFFAPYPYRSPFHTDDPQEEVARALEHVERVILQENPQNIAALLLEPVVGSDALVVYPDGYLKGLRRLTEKYGILLIHDEVMTGFGRVGEAFASIRFGVTPDLMTFAKGVASSYVPLAGVFVREGLAKQFDKQAFMLGHTYSGHPLAMAAGLGALASYKEGDLFQRPYQIEKWLHKELQALYERHKVVGNYRGLGAFFGIEFVRDRATKEPVVAWQDPAGPGVMGEFYRALLDAGVWVSGKYSIVVIAPPLTITRDELRDAFAIISNTLAAFEGRMAKGG